MRRPNSGGARSSIGNVRTPPPLAQPVAPEAPVPAVPAGLVFQPDSAGVEWAPFLMSNAGHRLCRDGRKGYQMRRRPSHTHTDLWSVTAIASLLAMTVILTRWRLSGRSKKGRRAEPAPKSVGLGYGGGGKAKADGTRERSTGRQRLLMDGDRAGDQRRGRR
jgi:hypothetical protein